MAEIPMALTATSRPDERAAVQHVLLVADWSVDPRAVVASIARRTADHPAVWSLLVPAWLHGLDWAGDPYASGPCAQRALLALRELAVGAGLQLDATVVGDPDPVTAVTDVCAAIDFDAILLCTPHRRPHLARRIHHATGLAVMREALPRTSGSHCVEGDRLAA